MLRPGLRSVWICRGDDLQQIVDHECRTLRNESSHCSGIRRNETQSSNWSGRSEPGRHARAWAIEAQLGGVGSFAAGVLSLSDQVLHVCKARARQELRVALVLRCFDLPRRDLAKV